MRDIERDSDRLIGQMIDGRYLIRRLIGQGGMGIVYEAHHTGLDKRVAIKFLLDRYAEDAEAVARFHNEARTASAIGHDNIIDVTDIGVTADGRSYIVMEYLEGSDLGEALAQTGPMDPERAVNIISQVLHGLSAAHQKGILHRDMKPENVFLTTRNNEPDFVKIMDFGISKVIAAHDSKVRLTATGTVVGTPVYMAPEQAQADPHIDQRLDLYAVGVMFFELLTGRPPFNAANYLALVTQHLHAEVPTLRSLRPELPASLEVVTHRALQKAPENRFASAEEFRAALPTGEQLYAAVNWDHRSTLAGEAVTSPHPSAVAAPTMQATGSYAPPSRAPWIIVAVALVLALGMVGFALLTRGDGGGSGEADVIASEATEPAASETADPTAAGADDPDPERSAQATEATLELGSTPEGASVYVDGEYYGPTPITIEKIAVGDHELRFEKDGFQELVATKAVRAGHSESFFAALASDSSGKRSVGSSRRVKHTSSEPPATTSTEPKVTTTEPKTTTEPAPKTTTEPAPKTTTEPKKTTTGHKTTTGSKPSPYD